MIISSRTPEGEPNRCPICRHKCRVEPSCLTPDAPCPSCGHLLWFPLEKTARSKRQRESSLQAERPKRPQGRPAAREPEVQAARLIDRLIRRGEKRLGPICPEFSAPLTTLKEPRPVERLLSLLHSANSWADLLRAWQDERVGAEAKATAG